MYRVCVYQCYAIYVSVWNLGHTLCKLGMSAKSAHSQHAQKYAALKQRCDIAIGTPKHLLLCTMLFEPNHIVPQHHAVQGSTALHAVTHRKCTTASVSSIAFVCSEPSLSKKHTCYGALVYIFFLFCFFWVYTFFLFTFYMNQWDTYQLYKITFIFLS